MGAFLLFGKVPTYRVCVRTWSRRRSIFVIHFQFVFDQNSISYSVKGARQSVLLLPYRSRSIQDDGDVGDDDDDDGDDDEPGGLMPAKTTLVVDKGWRRGVWLPPT